MSEWWNRNWVKPERNDPLETQGAEAKLTRNPEPAVAFTPAVILFNVARRVNPRRQAVLRGRSSAPCPCGYWTNTLSGRLLCEPGTTVGPTTQAGA